MEALMRWAEESFAALLGWVFEGLVLPLLHAAGFGGYAEQAFEASEFFLIGAVEVTLLATILGTLERWFPLEQQRASPDQRVDILYTLLQRLGLLPLLLFFLLTPAVDALDGTLRLHNFIPPKLEDAWPALNQSPLISFMIYLLILDFCAYWLHRLQHRFSWWWALHSLHHSQRRMSFWSDDRNHLLDNALIDGLFALVAIFIGVPPGQFITIVVATRVIESLSHANLCLSFGRIGERLLVSPRFHRMHHAIGAGHEGIYRGCNFAILFPLWDVLFGTANFAMTYPPTGIRDQLAGRSYGSGFWEQQKLGCQRLWHSLRHA